MATVSSAPTLLPGGGKKKMWVPLENNPEVMTALVHKMGLSTILSFHDVFSIDDPDLLAFVPRPANALLLVFPVSKAYVNHRAEEDASREPYNGKGPDEPVIWYKQTIGNACGMMGLLHAVSNGSSRDLIEPNSTLGKLMKEAVPLGPVDRANLLYNSESLETAHQSSAQEGQSRAPADLDDVDLHYVCFVKNEKTNHLWELDGARKGPLDRGLLDPEDDVLSEKALNMGPRKFMQREAEAGEMRFSILTLAPSLE